MSYDSEFNIRFVEAVEKHPCIYDYTRKDHSKRGTVENAWKAISFEMKVPVPQCREKWKNLRTAFARSLKKAPSGSSGNKKNKNYYLKDIMQFTVPFMKCIPQSGNLPFLKEHDSSNDSTESQLHSNHPEDSSQQDDPLRFENQNYQIRVLDPLATSKEDTETPNNNNSKKRDIAKSVANDGDKCFVEDVNWKKAKADNTVSESNNPDLNFFKSLLPDLEKMNDYQKRQFKKRTLDVIDSILCDASSQNFPHVLVSAPL